MNKNFILSQDVYEYIARLTMQDYHSGLGLREIKEKRKLNKQSLAEGYYSKEEFKLQEEEAYLELADYKKWEKLNKKACKQLNCRRT